MGGQASVLHLDGDFHRFFNINSVQISWRRPKNTRNPTDLTLTSLDFVCFFLAPSWPQHKFTFSKIST